MLKRSLFIFIFLVAIVMLSGPASATDYYVNNSHPSASDSNDGSESLPWSTIDHAAITMSEADTVYVSGGPYTEYISLKQGRTADNISFIGIDMPTIQYNGSHVFEIGAHNNAASGAHGITIDGFYVHNIRTSTSEANGITLAYFSGTDNVTIKNSIIKSDGTGTTGGPIWFRSNSGADSTIYNCTIYDYYGDGISIYPDDDIRDNLNISNNRIYASTSTTSPFGSGIYFGACNNSIVTNNIIYRAGYTGIKPVNAYNTTISNNIIMPDGYGHNAIEGNGIGLIFNNNTVLGVNKSIGDAWNVFYPAGTAYGYFNLWSELYAEDVDGTLTMAGAHQNNVIYRNVTATNHTGGIDIYVYGTESGDVFTCDNLVFDNYSVENNAVRTGYDYPIKINGLGTNSSSGKTDYDNYTRDTVTLIDINITGTNSADPISILQGSFPLMNGDVYLINVYDTDTMWYINNPDRCSAVLHEMYYPNIKVVNGNNQPVGGATITFVANITNPETNDSIYAHNLNYGGVEKAYTDTINSSLTLSDGKLPDRYENSSGAVALTKTMQYYTTSAQSVDVSWTVTATKDGETDSVIITPNMLTYSPDSSDRQSTLVTLTLGAEGSGSGGDETTNWNTASNSASSVYLRISSALFGALMMFGIGIIYFGFIKKNSTISAHLGTFLGVGAIITIVMSLLFMIAALIDGVI